MRQSDRMDAYAGGARPALGHGPLYPCTCTRRDIAHALSAPQEGAMPDRPRRPGLSRHLPPAPRCRAPGPRPRDGAAPRHGARRPRRRRTSASASPKPAPARQGNRRVGSRRSTLTHEVGDVVLARRDMGTSYHLSVVVDDAAQGITHVTRGADLFEATPIHVILQRLSNLPTPIYHHHRLIRDDRASGWPSATTPAPSAPTATTALSPGTSDAS
jgi:glutamyl-Q tRNA(Asp) synthetase